MGYLAGIVDKKGADASDRMLKMLQASSRGPAFSFGIGNNRDIESYRDTPEFTSISDSTIIGSKNIHTEHPEAPLNQGSESFVFKGMLFDNEGPDSLEVANLIEENPVDGLRELISKLVGAYSIAIASENEIICGLDHVGTFPLYYGESASHFAVATNRKMLWAVDTDAKPLEPGSILRMTGKGIQITEVKRLVYTKPQQMQETQTLDKLDSIFTEVSDQLTRKTGNGSVAFSGGVDSTLVAHYLSKSGADVKLITVGLENQKELEIAEKAASHHDWDIDIETHTEEDVENLLDEIILSVEEPHPMKVGIAYPFHWAAKNANKKGHSSMYSGNGADELFGGYKRYHSEFLAGGDVERMIFDDTTGSWLNNFHRDTKTCLDQGIRLVLPFAHPAIIDYGLSIPASMKLSKEPDCIRKTILRKLAKKVGILDEIADRPKKAAQYSTGVDKALRRIAKRKGFSIRELVESRFKEISRG
jgi:asparagine synthase (glutamine-hydrolysing)